MQCCLHDAENKIICESVKISSWLLDLSIAAVITSLVTVIDHLKEKHQPVPLKNNSIVSSDGCSAQFRSQFVFKLLSSIDSSMNITWYYNERHHGKGLMDGIGGTLKNYLNRAWCNVWEKRNWHTKTICGTCRQSIKSITALYLPAEDVLIDPTISKLPRELKILFKSTWLNSHLTSGTFLNCSFPEWLPIKAFFYTILWWRSWRSSKNWYDEGYEPTEE